MQRNMDPNISIMYAILAVYLKELQILQQKLNMPCK